jgi:hypothetical protein
MSFFQNTAILYFNFTSLKNLKMDAMNAELNNQLNMHFKTLFNRINPWIGLFVALCLIIPSLYEILDDPLLFNANHIILAVGLILMIIFLKQIFDRIINLEGME